MDRRLRTFRGAGHATHAFEGGTAFRVADGKQAIGSGCPAEYASARGHGKSRATERNLAGEQAAPSPAVMLHLRACYVSKAAILTALVQPVSVENRSPA
jgi:hypothetical protein